MNDVSWFLYFTDIVQGLSTLFGFLCPVIAIVGIVLLGVSFITDTVKKYRSEAKYGYDYDEIIVTPLGYVRPWAVFTIILAFLFAIIAIMIPSRQTMYMIAASQIGEQIIQLEEVQDIGGEAGGLAKDAIELLRQQISEQLAEKPVEAPKPD